jgi:hypothetical protein
MPEIPNRERLNSELTAAIVTLLGNERAAIEAMLGSPPATQNVPAQYWMTLRNGIMHVLTGGLRNAFIAAAMQQAGLLDAEQLSADVQRAAAAWVQQQAERLADMFVEGTKRQVLDGIVRFYTGGLSQVPLSAAVDAAFSAARASSLAVTSLTNAGYVGERALVGLYKLTTGVRILAMWQAEPSACPICANLHGLTEEQWPPQYAAGPGSPHPRCQCWVTWVEA